MRRTAQRGFTILEILIALVVLGIGILGIVALFPVGIKSTSGSVNDSNAAMLADSVYSALLSAFRTSSPEAVDPAVRICHDGCPASQNYSYAFNRPTTPNPAGPPVVVPTAGQGTDPTAMVFLLGRDPLFSAALNNIRTTRGEQVNIYDQFSWRLEVIRPTTAPLFNVRIEIFKNFTNVAVPATQEHPNRVHSFTGQVVGS